MGMPGAILLDFFYLATTNNGSENFWVGGVIMSVMTDGSPLYFALVLCSSEGLGVIVRTATELEALAWLPDTATMTCASARCFDELREAPSQISAKG